ncbi:uncharacterized protein LOC117398497 [Acipenser ruthenus]|uniref:uncharacterized protein LOC117398497 n=1 Tax=Acipenser ruthenus TaxID=7906 RepID=UPI0027405DBD|nr:uncharacterized protein LOC117398497 [Acipenser ruthenus]XP_058871946.1 uncharacterized protein LOC117398497 [Acipenser ruthenus]
MNPAGGVANKLWPDVENSFSVPPTWRRSFGATLTNIPAAENERRPPNRLRLKKRGVLKNRSRGGDENNIETVRDGTGAAVTPVQGNAGRSAGSRVGNESLQRGDSSRESGWEESPCVKRNRQCFIAREHREESAFLTEDEGTDEECGTASHEHSDEEESCSDFIEDSPHAPEASPCNHGIPELFQEHGIIGLSSQSFQVHFHKAVEDLTEEVKGNFLSQALYEKRLPGHLANAIPAEVVSEMTEEISTRLDSKLSEVFFVLSGKIDSLIRRVARTEKSIEMSFQKLRERIEGSENCGHRENVRILTVADSNPGQNAVAFF